MNIPPLDILLYCHDGRGMGHASRTIAIGMALRRLYPELKVLFVSGFPYTREFHMEAPLDWIKLTSYETEVKNGKSQGVDGKSNYNDIDLGIIRSHTLQHYIELFSPKLVLADHSPLGKHKELLPALSSSSKKKTKWVLGVRGVIGNVKQVRSSLAAGTFQKYYDDLLWYGDSGVLGNGHCQQLLEIYQKKPYETGYVSRMAELAYWQNQDKSDISLAGTIAIPWLNKSTSNILHALAKVLPQMSTNCGHWNIFIGDHSNNEETISCIGNLKLQQGVSVVKFGPDYHHSLARSRTALVYGGYNSLTDVLYSNTNSIIIERKMQDQEQQIHLERLCHHTGGQLTAIAEESVTPELLQELLTLQFNRKKVASQPSINLNGAEQTAQKLVSLL